MSNAAAHAAAFYREVAESGVVWGIRDVGGFPAPVASNGKRAMPFWSSESRALVVIREVSSYGDFSPVPIAWEVFCTRWVPGLLGDDLLAGVNWSGHSASGFDISPIELQRNVEALRNRT